MGVIHAYYQSDCGVAARLIDCRSFVNISALKLVTRVDWQKLQNGVPVNFAILEQLSNNINLECLTHNVICNAFRIMSS